MSVILGLKAAALLTQTLLTIRNEYMERHVHPKVFSDVSTQAVPKMLPHVKIVVHPSRQRFLCRNIRLAKLCHKLQKWMNL